MVYTVGCHLYAESKKYDKVVNMMKKKLTHRYGELVVNNCGALKGGRAGGVNYWGRDRLKDTLGNIGNIDNIL